jgi:murein DD-endopeptidase MepM/ murein hydrolase activator NlpD
MHTHCAPPAPNGQHPYAPADSSHTADGYHAPEEVHAAPKTLDRSVPRVGVDNQAGFPPFPPAFPHYPSRSGRRRAWHLWLPALLTVTVVGLTLTLNSLLCLTAIRALREAPSRSLPAPEAPAVPRNQPPVEVSAFASPHIRTETARPDRLPAYLRGFISPLPGVFLPGLPASRLPGATRPYRNGVNADDRHRGIDLYAPYGTPVVAAKDGVVVSIENETPLPPDLRRLLLQRSRQLGYTPPDVLRQVEGLSILLDHGVTGSVRTLSAYRHLSELPPSVRPGAHIAQGQTVGYIGNSGTRGEGTQEGAHLHFELITQHGGSPEERYLAYGLEPERARRLLAAVLVPAETLASDRTDDALPALGATALPGAASPAAAGTAPLSFPPPSLAAGTETPAASSEQENASPFLLPNVGRAVPITIGLSLLIGVPGVWVLRRKRAARNAVRHAAIVTLAPSAGRRPPTVAILDTGAALAPSPPAGPDRPAHPDYGGEIRCTPRS